jgi:hypothetical protein
MLWILLFYYFYFFERGGWSQVGDSVLKLKVVVVSINDSFNNIEFS